MEVQIIVEYKGKTYESETQELSVESENKIESISTGLSNGLMFDTGDARIYFPKKVLEESIISIYRCE